MKKEVLIIGGVFAVLKDIQGDNLDLTSLGYFLTKLLSLKNSFNKIFWVNCLQNNWYKSMVWSADFWALAIK